MRLSDDVWAARGIIYDNPTLAGIREVKRKWLKSVKSFNKAVGKFPSIWDIMKREDNHRALVSFCR